MQYDIRALSTDHLHVHLTVEATDEEDARRQIEARGLHASTIKPVRTSLLTSFSLFGSGNPSGTQNLSLLQFSQELLALLKAGLSIVEALETLQEKEAHEETQRTFTRLLNGLHEGKRFSAVLAEQPERFPPLYVGIIQAAEGTSDLPQSLERFIDYQKRLNSVRNKIVSAMIYPSILMVVGSGVTLFLLAYVVPRFADVYRNSGRSLPWMSQLMLNWGQFASTNAKEIALTVAVGGLFLFFAIRRFIEQGKLSRLIARIPKIGEHFRTYALARLYLTLGMLLEGGIPIIAALDTVEGVVSPDIRQGLQNARQGIQSGTSLSAAFKDNHLTTTVSLRMLRVGERSGELGKMLSQSASFYDEETGRWIERFTRIFEPVLMAAIGVVVGVVVVLLYMPIFDLAGSLS